jgi:hypothetical protein
MQYRCPVGFGPSLIFHPPNRQPEEEKRRNNIPRNASDPVTAVIQSPVGSFLNVKTVRISKMGMVLVESGETFWMTPVLLQCAGGSESTANRINRPSRIRTLYTVAVESIELASSTENDSYV